MTNIRFGPGKCYGLIHTWVQHIRSGTFVMRKYLIYNYQGSDFNKIYITEICYTLMWFILLLLWSYVYLLLNNLKKHIRYIILKIEKYILYI